MRQIDADALMEKLNGIWDCNDMTFEPVDGCCIDADCKSCRWRETIEYVKRLVKNQTTISQWRRVEEPPKEYGNYLAVVNGEVMEVTYSDMRDDWKWSTCDADGFVWIRSELVTHWMPLPEPPKEDA